MASLKSCLSSCFIVLIFAYFGFSQETVAQPDFASLKSQWVEMEKQLKEKELALGSGDSSGVDEFRNQIEQANALISELKTAGLEAFKADPANREAIQTLMGIMINDAQNGRDLEVLRLGDELIGLGINPRYFEVAADTERLDISHREIFEELGIRRREAAANDLPRVRLTTTKGPIVLELFENEAPNTVANFISLIESDFYSNILFHRVIENFMAQSGCPEGNGTGGPGYTISCECYEPDARRHFTGSLSMAKQDARDTGGSQFFITFKRTDNLDARHTVFGRVVEGADVLDLIARTHVIQEGRELPVPGVTKDSITKAEVIRKRDHEYRPRKVGEPADQNQPEAKQPPIQPETPDQPDQDKSGAESSSDKSDDK